MEKIQLRGEAAAGLESVRRGFGPDHMLARTSQLLYEGQFERL